MKLAYICSPCRGDYEKNIIKAQEYCREAMNDGLLPLAPHVYFTQFVDDSNPEERKLGLRCGLQLLRYCQLIRVYGCASAAAAYADQPAAAPLLAEADKSLREVTAVHINIDPTEASELGEMIANSLRNGSSMLRGGA